MLSHGQQHRDFALPLSDRASQDQADKRLCKLRARAGEKALTALGGAYLQPQENKRVPERKCKYL